MKLWRGSALFLLFFCFHSRMSGESLSRIRILDVCPNKARYAPGEPVTIRVVLQGPGEPLPQMGMLKVGFSHLGEPLGPVLTKAIRIYGSAPFPVEILWRPPDRDFTGYFVDVRLTTPAGQELARSQTAVDVSSEWNRFPRYGYLAHYSGAEGARPEAWIAELNEFHIDGLQFYDFQNRHEQPLAGSVAHPDSHWFDIAGRDVERDVLNRYLAAARQHNITTMAYNSSYSAYVYVHQPVISAGWATPDYDGGRFHVLRFTAGSAEGGHYIEVVVPSLRYWDVIVLKTEPNSAAM